MAEETQKKNGADYGEQNIITLEWYEHIRRRSGMYIGRLGNGERQGDGIYILLKEVIDNSVDEFSMGFGKRIDITIDEDKSVTVRDFGRGIPLGSVVDVTSKLNTGGKFDTEAFQKSVGMNGVGTKAVNALSSDFWVESFRDGQSSFAHYSRGILLDSGLRETTEKNGTVIRFVPDEQMFEGYSFHMDIVETMVKNYSYLKKGLTLVLNGVPYKSENGLLDLVTENMAEKPLYPLIHLEGPDIEIVLTHGNSYGENISSFVNGQNTRDGGTHLAAYREAIAKTFKDFFKKDYKPEDVRQGVVGAIAIQIQEPIFEGQTKTKLGSTYMWERQVKNKDGSSAIDRGPTIRSFINDFVSKNLDNYLHMNLDIVPVIEKKIKESQEDPRAEQEGQCLQPQAPRLPHPLQRQTAEEQGRRAGEDLHLHHGGRFRVGYHHQGPQREHPGRVLPARKAYQLLQGKPQESGRERGAEPAGLRPRRGGGPGRSPLQQHHRRYRCR